MHQLETILKCVSHERKCSLIWNLGPTPLCIPSVVKHMLTNEDNTEKNIFALQWILREGRQHLLCN
jgi:hypothetical protein